ncbi:MAG: hypothetical protein HC906_06250, partial [Bacteroidales bacterium]|nr:hypothetical protein [Bacteroidales bacterium]
MDIGRKTKGAEFTWICNNYSSIGCSRDGNTHIDEHYIYLFLDKALKPGKTYTVYTGELAENIKSIQFTYDEKMLRSDAVHVNQIGYSPLSPAKYGYIYHWMGDKGGIDLSGYAGNEFKIIDYKTHEVVYTGNIDFRKSADNSETYQEQDQYTKNFLGSEVYECNFSDFTTPGMYVLSVDSIGCSYPFIIDREAYRQPYYTTIRGLFHNRSGIELTEPYTEFTRPAPHNPEITQGFAGKLQYTTSRAIDWGGEEGNAKSLIEAGLLGPIHTWGWYQDAGDWDGYYSHSRIPILLMFTWEMKPENFKDNELNILESGNGIPDLLDEARWLIRYYYRTRHAILEAGYGTGGLGFRVAGDWFGNDEDPQGRARASYHDTTRMYIVSGEDPFATYQYAGLAAHFALCLKKAGLTDPEGIDWEQEALDAYNWAKNNTKTGDETNTSLGGTAGLRDPRAYAAASLYRMTADV